MRGVWMAVAALASACSLIVPAEPQVVYCRDLGHIGAPACGANQVCADGICEACSARDACGDGVDNDCNGFIDDGCPPVNDGQAGQAGAVSQ